MGEVTTKVQKLIDARDKGTTKAEITDMAAKLLKADIDNFNRHLTNVGTGRISPFFMSDLIEAGVSLMDFPSFTEFCNEMNKDTLKTYHRYIQPIIESGAIENPELLEHVIDAIIEKLPSLSFDPRLRRYDTISIDYLLNCVSLLTKHSKILERVMKTHIDTDAQNIHIMLALAKHPFILQYPQHVQTIIKKSRHDNQFKKALVKRLLVNIRKARTEQRENIKKHVDLKESASAGVNTFIDATGSALPDVVEDALSSFALPKVDPLLHSIDWKQIRRIVNELFYSWMGQENPTAEFTCEFIKNIGLNQQKINLIREKFTKDGILDPQIAAAFKEVGIAIDSPALSVTKLPNTHTERMVTMEERLQERVHIDVVENECELAHAMQH